MRMFLLPQASFICVNVVRFVFCRRSESKPFACCEMFFYLDFVGSYTFWCLLLFFALFYYYYYFENAFFESLSILRSKKKEVLAVLVSLAKQLKAMHIWKQESNTLEKGRIFQWLHPEEFLPAGIVKSQYCLKHL